MYAVIQTGGKQYRVTKGAKLKIEKIEAETDSVVNFDKVLMVGEGEQVKIGQPFVTGAVVQAKVLEQGRGEKIRIVKFRRRKHYMRHMGHRQWLTEVEITAING